MKIKTTRRATSVSALLTSGSHQTLSVTENISTKFSRKEKTILSASNLFVSVLFPTIVMKSPVVTLCTTRFNAQKFFVLPIRCIYVFRLDLRTNSEIISLYIINWMDFITETESVYCAVRAVSLNVIQVTFGPYERGFKLVFHNSSCRFLPIKQEK